MLQFKYMHTVRGYYYINNHISTGTYGTRTCSYIPKHYIEYTCLLEHSIVKLDAYGISILGYQNQLYRSPLDTYFTELYT